MRSCNDDTSGTIPTIVSHNRCSGCGGWLSVLSRELIAGEIGSVPTTRDFGDFTARQRTRIEGGPRGTRGNAGSQHCDIDRSNS